MNVRKPVDYGTMYRKLAAILARNLPQMDEIYAIGKAISQRPEKGAAVAAAEFLQANFPDRTGFSPRNVRRMRDFYRTYENDKPLLRLAMKIGWTLNVVIMEAELTRDVRKWYLEQARAQQWSKNVLLEKLTSEAYLEKSLDAATDTCYTDNMDSGNKSKFMLERGAFWKHSHLDNIGEITGLLGYRFAQLLQQRSRQIVHTRC